MLAGVIRNPKSRRNAARPLADRNLPPSVQIAEPDTLAALTETLRRFAAEGIRHLMIDGGDGTLRDVLGALPATYGTDWPALALCASGNTNLAVADVGGFPRGEGVVAQWHAALTGAQPLRESIRHPIEVRWPDGSRPPVYGFFVGCANYGRGVRMATGTLREKGLFHGWAVGATIAGAAFQVLSGGADNDWQRGSPVTLAVDDRAPESAARFVVLVTSLEKLLMGLWPFWSAPSETGPLRWLDITAPAPRFGRALPALLRGKPQPWMHASGAYRSGRAAVLRLQLREPLIIDGEPYEPDGEGRLELHAGPAVRFHAPR